MNFVYAYLRASTTEQDANRARKQLDQFVADHGQRIAAYFVENISGATLHRPELMRLLDTAKPGDTLLVESIDRLSRLANEDWEKLKRMISENGINIVAIDLPTTYMVLGNDELTASIMRAINVLIIDILAAVARKDYVMRRQRQAQGISKGRKEGKYRGRQPNTEKHNAIVEMLRHGISYSAIERAIGVSRARQSRGSEMQTKIFWISRICSRRVAIIAAQKCVLPKVKGAAWVLLPNGLAMNITR